MLEHEGMLEWSESETPLLVRSFSSWRVLLEDAPRDIELPIMLYRGEDSVGWLQSLDAGAAWTRDLSIAEFFSRWATERAKIWDSEAQPLVYCLLLKNQDPILAVYPVLNPNRKDAAFLVPSRDLSEVILDPDKIINNRFIKP